MRMQCEEYVSTEDAVLGTYMMMQCEERVRKVYILPLNL